MKKDQDLETPTLGKLSHKCCVCGKKMPVRFASSDRWVNPLTMKIMWRMRIVWECKKHKVDSRVMYRIGCNVIHDYAPVKHKESIYHGVTFPTPSVKGKLCSVAK